jgi:hypothetical protein
MAQYGELLNTFDPIKDQFSSYINIYFNHPTLTKTKNVDKHSVYMVKTYCLLSNESMFSFCFLAQLVWA